MPKISETWPDVASRLGCDKITTLLEYVSMRSQNGDTDAAAVLQPIMDAAPDAPEPEAP